jgi:Uncharacterised nucleotidyltransferase
MSSAVGRTGHGLPGAEGHDAPDRLAAQHAWLALLRDEFGPGQLLSDRQWAWLADEATRHHLRGVTYRRVADSPFAAVVPGEVWERLRSFYLETAGRNAVLVRQTSGIVQELAAREIPVLLLKGMHLAQFVYAEPGLRSMADVDIMVRREHLAGAERVFLERGYGPLPRPAIAEWCGWNHHLAKLTKTGAPEVELHWSIQRPTGPFRIDLEGLWQRSRAATLDGAPVRLLSPEDLLLHLTIHLSHQHYFRRAALKGVVDIATVVATQGSRIDWRLLARRAIDWGASGVLYTTLRLTEELLAVPVPPSLLQQLPHAAQDEEVVEVARRFILELHTVLPTAYRELARTGSLRTRTRLLAGAVFLPRERMEQLYGLRPGTPLVFPCYGLRLASLLRKRSGLLLQSLFRGPVIQQTVDREQDRQLLERWSSLSPG